MANVRIADTTISAQEVKVMSKMEFAQKVAELVGGVAKEVDKANGTRRTGICCGDGNVRPTIYIDEMYDDGVSVEDAAAKVREVADGAPALDVNIDDVNDYEMTKDKLRLRLYNNSTKAEVFWPADEYGFDDLIIIPYIQFSDEAAAKVTNGMMKIWDVSKEQLFKDAFRATAKCEFKIKGLGELIRELMPDAPDFMLPPVDDMTQVVVTNSSKMFGSIGIIIKRAELAEKFPNGYFVLPSSVHECIIMPNTGNENKAELDDMVRSVNEAEVAPEEVLGWGAYRIVA